MAIKLLDTLIAAGPFAVADGADVGVGVSFSGVLELDDPNRLDALATAVDGLNIQQSSGQFKAFDRFKLDQLTETTSVSAVAQLAQDVVIGRHEDTLNFVPANWEAYTLAAGLPTNVGSGGTKTNYVRVPDNVTVTDCVGSESGTGTVTLQADAGFVNEKVYQVTIPQQTSATNIFTLNGTVESITRINPSATYQIDGFNLDTELHDRIYSSDPGTTPATSDDVAQFHSRIDVVRFPGTQWAAAQNPTPLRSTLTRKFAAYWDENRVGATPFTGNYFQDQADPTITGTRTDRYFSEDGASDATVNPDFPGRQSYFTGELDVDGLPLTNTFTKMIGFDIHIAHTLPSSDTPILRFGATELIGVDSQGPYVLRGNGDGTIINTSADERLPISGTGFEVGVNSGNTIGTLRGTGSNSVSYDALETTFNGNAVTYPLALTISFRRVENGEGVTGAATASYTITDRDVSQAQTTQTVSIPRATGSADETITFEYNATTKQVIIGTTGISTNGSGDVTQLTFTVGFNDTVEVNESDTASKVRIGPTNGAVGNTISFLFIMEATNPLETSADKFMTFKAVVNGRQENNVDLRRRASNYDFSNMVFGPDSGENVAIAGIQIYEWDDGGTPFNAPTHSELYNLWTQRANWLGRFRAPNYDHLLFDLVGDFRLQNEDDENFFMAPKLVYPTSGNLGDIDTSTLASSLDLTDTGYENYAFLHVYELVSGEIRATDILIGLLPKVGSTLIRSQGNTDYTWTDATDVLATTPSASTIVAAILAS